MPTPGPERFRTALGVGLFIISHMHFSFRLGFTYMGAFLAFIITEDTWARSCGVPLNFMFDAVGYEQGLASVSVSEIGLA